MTTDFPPPGYIAVESKVPGIDVYMPAPKTEADQREVVEYTCPQCGATTAFSVADGGLTCVHCNYYEPPKGTVVGKKAERFEFTIETLERSAHGWGEARKELECQNCGARSSLPAEALTHTCAFCGSNKVVQRQADQESLRPRFLVPFKITAEKCAQIARDWLGSSWMTPAALKSSASLQAFTPVFIPYWTFAAVANADWRAEVGHARSERYYDHSNKQWKTRTVIVWRWESGHVQLNIEDLLIPGASRLSALHLAQAGNFDLRQLAPYEPTYLAGLQAQSYDLPLEKAWEQGREEMRERTRQACRSQAASPHIRNFSMSLDFSAETWRYILLPVYVAAYSYQSKIYQVIVNGQSGAIAGQRPADWNKVWLVIAALIFPGLLLGLAGLLTLPLAGIGVIIGALGGVFLIVGIIIAIIILVKASRMDDV